MVQGAGGIKRIFIISGGIRITREFGSEPRILRHFSVTRSWECCIGQVEVW